MMRHILLLLCWIISCYSDRARKLEKHVALHPERAMHDPIASCRYSALGSRHQESGAQPVKTRSDLGLLAEQQTEDRDLPNVLANFLLALRLVSIPAASARSRLQRRDVRMWKYSGPGPYGRDYDPERAPYAFSDQTDYFDHRSSSLPANDPDILIGELIGYQDNRTDAGQRIEILGTGFTGHERWHPWYNKMAGEKKIQARRHWGRHWNNPENLMGYSEWDRRFSTFADILGYDSAVRCIEESCYFGLLRFTPEFVREAWSGLVEVLGEIGAHKAVEEHQDFMLEIPVDNMRAIGANYADFFGEAVAREVLNENPLLLKSPPGRHPKDVYPCYVDILGEKRAAEAVREHPSMLTATAKTVRGAWEVFREIMVFDNDTELLPYKEDPIKIALGCRVNPQDRAHKNMGVYLDSKFHQMHRGARTLISLYPTILVIPPEKMIDRHHFMVRCMGRYQTYKTLEQSPLGLHARKPIRMRGQAYLRDVEWGKGNWFWHTFVLSELDRTTQMG